MIAAPKARSHGLTTGGGALVTFTGISAASAVVVDNAAPTAAARIDTFFIRLPLLASRPVAAEGPRQGHHCSGAKSRKPVERRSRRHHQIAPRLTPMRTSAESKKLHHLM